MVWDVADGCDVALSMLRLKQHVYISPGVSSLFSGQRPHEGTAVVVWTN